MTPVTHNSVNFSTRDDRVRLEQYRATLRLAGAEIERRNRVIRALTAFTYQASRLTEPAALLNLALTQAVATTHAGVGAIVLIDAQTKALMMGTHRGLSTELVQILTGRQFSPSATVLMPHLVTGKGALLELSKSSSDDERELLALGELSSLASLPLQAGHRLLGALVVGIQGGARFTAADVHYLLAIAQGTAVALESLSLREKLWHMAENMLTHDSLLFEDSPSLISDSRTENGRLTEPDLPMLPPVQSELANIVADLGGTMGAVFILTPGKKDTQVTLAADYGLSPVFTNAYANFKLSDGKFPFEQLSRRHLLVKRVVMASKRQQIPLLASLQEEGVRSLLAVQFSTRPGRIIFVGSTKPETFQQSDIDHLLDKAPRITPLLKETPAVPTLPTHSVHVPSLEREATDDDLEQLLAAMMEAEEEVERHNRDWLTLNNIAELLNQTLYLNTVLPRVLEKTREVLNTEAIWLYLLAADPRHPKRMRLQTQLGLSGEFVRALNYISVGDGFEGDVAAHNKARFVDDVLQDAIHCHLLIELEELQSVAAVPLACPDFEDGQEQMRVVGVVATGTRTPYAWSSRAVRLLTSIANQMAFSVNNAQLYAQLKEDVQVLSASNEMLSQLNEQLLGGEPILVAQRAD